MLRSIVLPLTGSGGHRSPHGVGLWQRAVAQLILFILAGFAQKAMAEAPLAPTIYAQPQSRTVRPGTLVSFKVDANGYPTLNYRWRRNGTTYSSTNSSFLNVVASGTTNSFFDVVITNAFGAITSSIAALTVTTQAVSISQEPVGQVSCPGATVFLSAIAGGVNPVAYQWQFNGVDLPGAGGSSLPNSNFIQLILSAVTSAKSGDYTLIVSNSFGALTSAVATVTIDPPFPIISQHPRSQIVSPGGTATLSVSANSCTSLFYQWRSNGVDLAGATGSSLTFSPATTNLSAQYDVIVTSATGSTTSRAAWLVITSSPPSLTCQPQSRSVFAGSNVLFSVCASGQTPLTYLWRKDGNPVSQGTNFSPNYLINYVLPSHAGNYDVVVTNLSGSVTSAVATLTVLTSAPTIISNPPSQTANAGQAVFLIVRATGAPPPAYQWQKDGNDLPGKTNYFFSITNVNTPDAGDYRAIAYNSVGAVTSGVARIAVNLSPAVILTNPPPNLSVAVGQTVVLSAQASGAPPPALQWQKDGVDLQGKTNSFLVLSNAAFADAGDYRMIACNAAGCATSAVSVLTVTAGTPPSILTQPRDQTISMNYPSNANFFVIASGTTPLRYQWFHNGQAISNAIYSSLTVYPNSPGDAGDYLVVVANSAGAVTSAVARLTLIPFTVYIYNIGSYNLGGSAELGSPRDIYFTGTPYGPDPFWFQWFHNQQAIPQGTNRDLYLGPITTSDAGEYFLVAGNSFGSSTSAVLTLTVLVDAPHIFLPPMDVTVVAGSPYAAYVGVGATGALPLDFYWFHNGQPIAGTSASNVFNNSVYFGPVTSNDAGDYFVIVSNFVGTVTSRVARVTVTPGTPPQIEIQPQSQFVIQGFATNVFFYVYASGTEPLNYQWFHNGQPIAGASDSYFGILFPTNSDLGDYFVTVSNVAGVVTSAVARLTLTPIVVSIQNASSYNLGGSGAVEFGSPRDTYFSSYVYGWWPISYQWYHNGQPFPGANDANLVLGPITLSDNGQYFLVASNTFGAATSEVSTLTVLLDPPYIFSQPAGETIEPGSPYGGYIVCGATGALPLDFYWFHDGQPIAGTPSDAFNNLVYFGPVTTNDAGSYFVIVSNFLGTVTSVVANIKVEYRPPSIITQPADLTILRGAVGAFCVTAAGSPPLTYQWQQEGTNLPSETYSCLIVSSFSNVVSDYQVIISNPAGSVTSRVARLAVVPNIPSFITQPVPQDAGVGASLALFANSTNAASFQWQFNGQNISSHGNTYVRSFYPFALFLDDIQTNQAGQYSVVLTNWDGSITSQVVNLTVPSGPLEHWQWSNPLPQGNDLYHATYGNGSIVAVGWEGAKAISTDGGITWEAHNKSRADLQRVAYGNGIFVAISSFWVGGATDSPSYRLQTSADGRNWTDRQIGLTNVSQLLDIAFGNGRFVAIASLGGVIVSSNGLDWVQAPWPNSWNLGRITFGNDLFLITDRGGSLVSYATSSDGLSWTNHSLAGAGYVFDATFGNGKFGILGNLNSASPAYGTTVLSTSADGVTWTNFYLPNSPLASVAAGNNKWVAVGGYQPGVIYTSSDGLTWHDHSDASSNALYGVAFCNDRFVALGNYGTLLTSTDGEDWQPVQKHSSLNLRALARGNGRYVAVGNEGTVFTSVDGENWARLQLPTTANLRGVTFGAGRFVVVGANEPNRATIFISINGLDWTPSGFDLVFDLYSVAYGSGRFVAVGEFGALISSNDGVNWLSEVSHTSRRLNTIIYAAGRFVAVGKKGTVVTSHDRDWNAVSYGYLLKPDDFLQGIAYGNGAYVAVGQGGALLVSTDGVIDGGTNGLGSSWFSPPSPFSAPYQYFDIEDVQFGNGCFLAVGQNGLIATSTNGILWTRHYSGCQNDLRGALYADCRFYAVGNNETILQSAFNGPPMLQLAPPLAGGVNLSLNGEPGSSYRLQTSTDLIHWSDLLSYTNTHPPTTWRDTNASSQSRRFYRAVAP